MTKTATYILLFMLFVFICFFSCTFSIRLDERGTPMEEPEQTDPATVYYQPPETVSGTTYDVGPGQVLAEIQDVPWQELAQGDLVRIHYRPEPYRGFIGIQSSGTESDPIRIYGIAGPGGELPVISGENAVAGPNLSGFFNQWTTGLGLVMIKSPGSGTKTKWVEIANLKIEKAKEGYTYNDGYLSNGEYSQDSCGIWVQGGHISILGCTVTQNSMGIFSQLKDGDLDGIQGQGMTSDLLIEGNHVYENGVSGYYRVHNLYLQSVGVTVQFNTIGTLVEGGGGGALKIRGSGMVIRYNRIESAQRCLDILEIDVDHEYVDWITDDPADAFNYDETWVYGNILINEGYPPNYGALSLIHYGYDMKWANALEGTMYFYHNTVYFHCIAGEGYPDISYKRHIFDIERPSSIVEMFNNVFEMRGTQIYYWMNNYDRGYGDGPAKGNLYLKGGNWATDNIGLAAYSMDPAYDHIYCDEADHDPERGSLSGAGILSTDTAFSLTDPENRDFKLLPSSSALQVQTSVLPGRVSSTNVLNGERQTQTMDMRPVYQYRYGMTFTPRTSWDLPGAVEDN